MTMSWDEAVQVLSSVARAPALEVAEGTYGPLITLTAQAQASWSPNVVESGVLLVDLERPGGALFFSDELVSEETASWVDQVLAWSAGERDVELVELGAIDDPAPRQPLPPPRALRGTVMSVQEAGLGPLAQTQEALDVLAAPYAQMGGTPPELHDVWLLMVDMVD